jgi:hypothetical protein
MNQEIHVDMVGGFGAPKGFKKGLPGLPSTPIQILKTSNDKGE